MFSEWGFWGFFVMLKPPPFNFSRITYAYYSYQKNSAILGVALQMMFLFWISQKENKSTHFQGGGLGGSVPGSGTRI